MQVINVSVVILFVIILSLSIVILLNNHICDYQTCRDFVVAFKEKEPKAQLITLLDNLCEDWLLSFGVIASLIITCLIFCILPIDLSALLFIAIFLLTLIAFYYILAFYIYYYVRPIKQYIIEYLEKT